MEIAGTVENMANELCRLNRLLKAAKTPEEKSVARANYNTQEKRMKEKLDKDEVAWKIVKDIMSKCD